MTDDPSTGLESRPVFEGAWNSATVAEREAHNAAVRAWKAAQGIAPSQRTGGVAAKAGSPMVAGDGQPERHADDLRALQQVIDHAPIQSDRIRAIEAKQRILARTEAEALAEAHGPLVELGKALSAIPDHERVSALGALLAVEG